MPKRRTSPARVRSRSFRNTSAFINIPYDQEYEDLYLAFIAGLSGFGLIPRATLEIPTSERRLDRIFRLIRGCRYSFHDLSRVELDREPPVTPRFNMPFELGLAVAWAKMGGQGHQWFVFESAQHRLSKSLSDIGGTDPCIHYGTTLGILRALMNALLRNRRRPTVSVLEEIYRDLKGAANTLKTDLRTKSLFEARAFRELVTFAGASAEDRIASTSK